MPRVEQFVNSRFGWNVSRGIAHHMDNRSTLLDEMIQLFERCQTQCAPFFLRRHLDLSTLQVFAQQLSIRTKFVRHHAQEDLTVCCGIHKNRISNAPQIRLMACQAIVFLGTRKRHLGL